MNVSYGTQIHFNDIVFNTNVGRITNLSFKIYSGTFNTGNGILHITDGTISYMDESILHQGIVNSYYIYFDETVYVDIRLYGATIQNSTIINVNGTSKRIPYNVVKPIIDLLNIVNQGGFAGSRKYRYTFYIPNSNGKTCYFK